MQGYDFEFISIDGEKLPLSQYRGRPLLVVNTASFCGFTPQYQDLEALWRKYRDRGLVIIGDGPCKDGGSGYADAPGLKKGLSIGVSMEDSGHDHAPFRRTCDGTNGLGGETSQVRINRHRVANYQKTHPAIIDDLSGHAAGGAETWTSVAGIRPRDLDQRLRRRNSRGGFRRSPQSKNQLCNIRGRKERIPVRSQSRLRYVEADLERTRWARPMKLALRQGVSESRHPLGPFQRHQDGY